jgi:hemerythrin-like domain-containing protein
MALRRSEALQPLSRQHHQGLLVSLFLTNGLKKNASIKSMKDFILQFWEEDLNKHFEVEEQILIPFTKEYPTLEEGLKRMLLEHQNILLLINKLNNEARVDQLETIAAFALQIDQHIRFEERVLFEQLQETLTPAHMAELNLAFGGLKEKDFCQFFPDKFWE